ncbi:MAG: cytochrome c biogenesis protein CcsA [Pseudomonadales bacterium]|nr:cytochrome c biogenesis protein CcsA [Halioglobus sp.]MCP5130663.1 cytochrome c biogenesis protein CcsA [Pseudomonadales bacterium]
MPVTILAPLAALLYLAATALQLLHIFQHKQQSDRWFIGLAVAALLCHAGVVWLSIFPGGGIELGFYKVSALIFLAINIVCIASLARRPLQNLLVALFPLSALAVVVSTYAPESAPIRTDLPAGILLHIGSSILAYAVLTLAAAQAALLAVQDHHLKHRRTRGLVQILPPLQLMETMLFELLWVGEILLTVAILSGFVFLDDIFAQHLVHKTVLTLGAWLLLAVLLWGHYQLGWRSKTAVRLTLTGFALLVLAYFGTKLVLELVLKKG